MKTTIPLEFFISDMAAIGFFLFFPATIFLIVGVILAFLKKRKEAKIIFIIAGSLLLIAGGLCSFG